MNKGSRRSSTLAAPKASKPRTRALAQSPAGRRSAEQTDTTAARPRQKELTVQRYDYDKHLVGFGFGRGAEVYYDDRERPPCDAIVTCRCVVKLPPPDGRVLVRDVFKGSKPGTWTLIDRGSAPPIVDQALVWAEPVTAVRFPLSAEWPLGAMLPSWRNSPSPKGADVKAPARHSAKKKVRSHRGVA